MSDILIEKLYLYASINDKIFENKGPCSFLETLQGNFFIISTSRDRTGLAGEGTTVYSFYNASDYYKNYHVVSTFCNINTINIWGKMHNVCFF